MLVLNKNGKLICCGFLLCSMHDIIPTFLNVCINECICIFNLKLRSDQKQSLYCLSHFNKSRGQCTVVVQLSRDTILKVLYNFMVLAFWVSFGFSSSSLSLDLQVVRLQSVRFLVPHQMDWIVVCPAFPHHQAALLCCDNNKITLI